MTAPISADGGFLTPDESKALARYMVGLLLDTDDLWESLPQLRLASIQAVDTAMQSFATDLMADSLGADLYRRYSG